MRLGVTLGFPEWHGWQRLRLLLVAFEVALALVLLIGAGMMIRSFFRLREVNIGLDPLNVLTMNTTLTVISLIETSDFVKLLRGLEGWGRSEQHEHWGLCNFAKTACGRIHPLPFILRQT